MALQERVGTGPCQGRERFLTRIIVYKDFVRRKEERGRRVAKLVEPEGSKVFTGGKGGREDISRKRVENLANLCLDHQGGKIKGRQTIARGYIRIFI